MSCRNVTSTVECRGQDSSDEEDAIIPEIHAPSQPSTQPAHSHPGTQATTDGPEPAPPRSAGSPVRRPRRLDRDCLFWTLIGNNRPGNSRSRSSGGSQARAPRPTAFLDLLDPERFYTSRPPFSLGSNGTAGPRLPNLDMSRRGSERTESASSRPPSTGGRPFLVLRSDRPSERRSDTPDGASPDAMQPLDEDMEVQAGSPQAVESADEYVETVIEVVEEPINMSTASMSLEEVVVDPPSPPAAVAEVIPSGSSEEPMQQPRGVKRKRDNPEVTGDTHESVSTLNMSLLRLLECPVCMEWMEPPIAQCRRGHLVCGACRKRLAACPVCRTTFSSVRNRAMEQVAGILRYPCRHGCGREVRQARRARHEASCAWRRYGCPLPACEATPPMPRAALPAHCQSRHPQHFKSGPRQRVSLRVNCEQHQHWVVAALGQLFHARVDVDVHTWGVVVYVAYVGPQNHARDYTYEVTVTGRHNGRKLVYKRSTHSDLENSQLNTSRQDCFHLTLDQALNFLRFKNEHSETDKTLDFTIVLAECEPEEESREISDASLGVDNKP